VVRGCGVVVVMRLPLFMGRCLVMHAAFEEVREARVGKDDERKRDGYQSPGHQREGYSEADPPTSPQERLPSDLACKISPHPLARTALAFEKIGRGVIEPPTR